MFSISEARLELSSATITLSSSKALTEFLEGSISSLPKEPVGLFSFRVVLSKWERQLLFSTVSVSHFWMLSNSWSTGWLPRLKLFI